MTCNINYIFQKLKIIMIKYSMEKIWHILAFAEVVFIVLVNTASTLLIQRILT